MLTPPPRKLIDYNKLMGKRNEIPSPYCEISERIVHHNGISYSIIAPPHAGARSLTYFLVKNGFLKLPEPFQLVESNPKFPYRMTKENLHLVMGHIAVNDQPLADKIVITVRNPFDRAATTIYKRLLPHQEITEEECVHTLYVYFQTCNQMFQFFLQSQTPDYVVKVENHYEDIKALPFVTDMSEYRKIDDKYDREILKISKPIDLEKKAQLRETIRKGKARDFVLKHFEKDFEVFGYNTE